MGRTFRVARLIGLAVVWQGQTRADIALKQVDHRDRNRANNDPANLNFLEEKDDAGRNAESQNMRAAWQLKPWREETSDAAAPAAAPVPILVDDDSDASSAAAPAPILSDDDDDDGVPEIPGTTI